MPRRPKIAPPVTQPAAPLPLPRVHVIRPHGVYFPEQVARILRLGNKTVARALSSGKIPFSQRFKKRIILGEWILAWLRDGKVTRRPTRQE